MLTDALRDIVRAERERQGLSQTDLGKLCNLHRNSVYAWETGKGDISITHAIAMLGALGLKVEIP